MFSRIFIAFAITGFLSISSISAEELTLFELRTYHANPEKLDELHARFRNHTMGLFEKHGMTNIVYWVPEENEQNLLIYLLGYPDQNAREASWKSFRDDPEWKEVYASSTMNGKLVGKVESTFLTPTDYSPGLPFANGDQPRLFEMRRYTTNEEKLDDLDARFRDHTIKLFEKHGITNLHYFHLAEGEEGRDRTLIYFIASPSKEDRDASFKAFSQDPAWKAARDASEESGKLLIKKGVQSTFLLPIDYSPLQ